MHTSHWPLSLVSGNRRERFCIAIRFKTAFTAIFSEIRDLPNLVGKYRMCHCVCDYNQHPKAWNNGHDTETYGTLLALCEGNPPVTVGFPSKGVSDEML